MTETRICVLGDGLVAGIGDPKGLGWAGRVAARTPEEAAVTVFPLGVPDEGTAALAGRWWEESSRRFGSATGTATCRLVVGLGHEDALDGVTLARSRLNLANVLDAAHSRGLPTFVVGPPPPGHPDLDERIEELSAMFGDVCRRRDVPFVDAFTPLQTHESWLTDLASGDGRYPRQAGYGLIAWLVLHGGWYEWLGVPRP